MRRDYAQESELERLSRDIILIDRMIMFGNDIFETIRVLDSLSLDRSEQTFLNAVCKPLDAMGEQLAQDKLSYRTRNEYDFPWLELRRIRNLVCHQYEEVTNDEVFEFIDTYLDEMIDELEHIKSQMQSRINILSR